MKTKIQHLLVALAVTVFLPTEVAARLGETIAQCNARYGQPEKTTPAEDTVVKLYHQNHLFNGYRVSIYFMNGKSANEEFIRLDKSKSGEREISEKDQEAILRANTKLSFKRINHNKYVKGVYEWSDEIGSRAFRHTQGDYPRISLSTSEYSDYNRVFFDKLKEQRKKEEDQKKREKADKSRERLQGF